jgi:hypothetical protein
VAEAAQHEPFEAEATIQAGRECRLGRIVLQPARLKLTLRLTNPKQGEEYKVKLRHSDGGGIFAEARCDTEAAAVFEALPARAYCVLFQRKDGYFVAQESIDVSAPAADTLEIPIRGQHRNGPDTVMYSGR